MKGGIINLRKLAVLVALALVAGLMALGGGQRAVANGCTATGFFRDGIDMTAALINPAGTVSGDVDATGCNIGVYYAVDGTIDDAEIYGANYFGVVNNSANVDIINSDIYNIGETPFNGTQHGVGIYFAFDTDASGTIANNNIWNYQKGGITVNGTDTWAEVYDNTVTGLGQVDFIAQNGIQFGWEANGIIRGNVVSENWYTGCSNKDAAKTGCIPWVSAGLLLYNIDSNSVKHSKNQFRDNQFNLLLLTSQSLNPGP